MAKRPDGTMPDVNTPLRIGLLGTLRLSHGAEPRPLPRTAAARALLDYLALHHGRPLPRGPLAGTFWPDRPDADARKALSDALWQVRQCLGPAAGRLAVERDAICFTLLPHDTLDVDSFSEPLRRHREQLQGGSLPPAALSTGLAALDAAVALYRADLLEDCYDDWVLPEREQHTASHEQAYVQSVEEMVAFLQDQMAGRRAPRRGQRGMNKEEIIRQHPQVDPVDRPGPGSRAAAAGPGPGPVRAEHHELPGAAARFIGQPPRW